MMWKKLGKVRLIALAAVMVISVGLWAGLLTTKGRYHEDEVYTISSVVDEIWEDLLVQKDAEGVPLVRTKEEYADFMSFKGVNLPMVYHNQWVDVHPPLYYMVLHVLVALMPWGVMVAGFVLNILAFIVIDVMIVKILQMLRRDKVILPAVILANFSVIAINMISYQRMYVLLAMFVMLTLYQNLRIWKNDFKLEKKEVLWLGLTVLAGFLTQYFYVIFVLPVFVMMVVEMVRRKRGAGAKKGAVAPGLWRYVGAHAGAAVLGVALYPICFEQILFGYRGVGAMADTSSSRLQELMAGLNVGAVAFLVVAIAAVVWWIWREKKAFWTWLMVLPVVFYLMVVLMTAPWLDFRYFSPVLVLPLLWVALMADDLLGKVKWGEWAAAAGMLVIAGLSLVVGEKPYLFGAEAQEMLDWAREESGNLVVYVSHYGFNAIQNIREYMIYDETAVVDYNEDMEKLGRVIGEREGFVLRVDNWLDSREVVEKVESQGWKVVEARDAGKYPWYKMVRG